METFLFETQLIKYNQIVRMTQGFIDILTSNQAIQYKKVI